ncbi:hypothetical protein NECAME_14556 [Necator americanus]|uniref:Uncharacterized protein n=1 Tax=Necator americanus TaxID=51031 RepID=W2SM71_NECAM|nr:hypothetical protein NECAME_14556 [Necator americanus]ETN70754.1 hypothetical protein NECAME_14556 [Necator americanus]
MLAPVNLCIEYNQCQNSADNYDVRYRIMGSLPYNSYARKNIGYLYAISNGAEWIYDTDDDNKPFGLGLEQFEYSNETSGLRYGCSSPDENKKSKKAIQMVQIAIVCVIGRALRLCNKDSFIRILM